jgi:hypothetical protein
MGWKRIDYDVPNEWFAAFERDFKGKARFLIDESLVLLGAVTPAYPGVRQADSGFAHKS